MLNQITADANSKPNQAMQVHKGSTVTVLHSQLEPNSKTQTTSSVKDSLSANSIL